jgi:hypothetical protein
MTIPDHGSHPPKVGSGDASPAGHTAASPHSFHDASTDTAREVEPGDTGTRGAVPGSPTLALEIECCDNCAKAFTQDKLWPVYGHGLCCWACIEHIRDLGLTA